MTADPTTVVAEREPDACHCGTPRCNLGGPAGIRDGYLSWRECEQLQALFSPAILRMVLARAKAMADARESGRLGVAVDIRAGVPWDYAPTIPAPTVPGPRLTRKA